MATEAAITPYGQKNAQAPTQLDLFSFLVGKWQGVARVKLPDGKPGEFKLTWIGRYILNGMAIADEFHSLAPDGSPYLGISLRQFDTTHDSWVIEYLNVPGSFLRRQVNPEAGSVSVANGAIVVISEEGPKRIREHYRVADHDHFSYSTDGSSDGGQSWDPPAFEMTMARVE